MSAQRLLTRRFLDAFVKTTVAVGTLRNGAALQHAHFSVAALALEGTGLPCLLASLRSHVITSAMCTLDAEPQAAVTRNPFFCCETIPPAVDLTAGE
jgi:hypothetical protein